MEGKRECVLKIKEGKRSSANETKKEKKKYDRKKEEKVETKDDDEDVQDNATKSIMKLK